jgi:hypothetical protein
MATVRIQAAIHPAQTAKRGERCGDVCLTTSFRPSRNWDTSSDTALGQHGSMLRPPLVERFLAKGCVRRDTSKTTARDGDEGLDNRDRNPVHLDAFGAVPVDHPRPTPVATDLVCLAACGESGLCTAIANLEDVASVQDVDRRSSGELRGKHLHPLAVLVRAASCSDPNKPKNNERLPNTVEPYPDETDLAQARYETESIALEAAPPAS